MHANVILKARSSFVLPDINTIELPSCTKLIRECSCTLLKYLTLCLICFYHCAWFVFILFFFLFHCRCPRNWKTSEPDTHSRPRGTLDFLDMQGPLTIHGPFPHEASSSLLCSQSQWCLQEAICPFCLDLLSAVCMVCGSLNTCSGLKGLCLLLMWCQVLGLQFYDHSCIQSQDFAGALEAACTITSCVKMVSKWRPA